MLFSFAFYEYGRNIGYLSQNKRGIQKKSVYSLGCISYYNISRRIPVSYSTYQQQYSLKPSLTYHTVYDKIQYYSNTIHFHIMQDICVLGMIHFLSQPEMTTLIFSSTWLRSFLPHLLYLSSRLWLLHSIRYKSKERACYLLL